MKPLYNESDYLIAKSTDKLPCKCYLCGVIFYEHKKIIANALRPYHHQKTKYCSHKCANIANRKKIKTRCANCGVIVEKTPSEFNKSKSGNVYCSKSCAVTYNNKHKTTTYRRSKLEKWLENELIILYPNLIILFNDKLTINSELDIYIPSLKLAFELNGIFHYEPIYGQDKLNQIQNNDNRKFQACLEQGIELCFIDTSQQKYFKEQTSKKYLDVIINVLNTRLMK